MPEEPDLPQPPPEAATQWMPPPSDGGSILPPAYAPLREVIGDYEIVAKIGQGGMGAVYQARQVSLDRQVALKLLPAQMVGDEEAVARFRREARVASSLRHANLVAVYAAGEADGCHFIAMELIEGEDLGCRLKRGEPLTAPEALRVCAEVVRALEHGWRSAQLIHRDIKPSNIFLAADGAVKLGDLGLAKSLLGNSTGLTQTGAMMGTAHYMSPEQARGDRELDFRADIYSLGCTLYQMLTGQVPYRGSDAITIIRQHLDAPLPAIMKVWPQCPVPLARLVGRMLKKSRHERPASYANLLGQIDSVWAQIDPVGHSPEAFAPPSRTAEVKVTAPSDSPPLAAPPHPPLSKNLLYGGLAAGVLVLASVAFVFWPKAEPLTKAQIIAAQRAAAAKVSAHDSAGTAQTSEDEGGGKAGGDKAPPTKASVTTGSAPSTLPANSPDARLSPSAEPWQDVLRDPAKLVLTGGTERTPEGLRFTDSGLARLRPGQSPRHDGAVRMLATFGDSRPQLRARANTAGVYLLAAKSDQKTVWLGRFDNVTEKTTALREFPVSVPFQPGQDYELELRIVGQGITVKCNGEALGTLTDGTYREGEFAVGLPNRNAAPALVKALEVLDLDAPAGANATSSNATKDAPFVNTLGMKFVPVAITGGPSGGQRVLFSVWETRVQDYEVFAKETKRELGKVNFPQEATHPALSVSWDDAQAFCTWLTERERKAGKFGAIEIYRLPSDYEWSCAVGLGEREDAAKTPAEKSLGIRDAYPWGSAWPPPAAAGNYSGEEAVGHENFKAQPILTAYRDDFPAPAPVGSFAANALGIFDLGGNAWEWCADWWDGQQQKRVQRGASFDVGERSMMWSSKRERNTPAARLGSTGFRIVLAQSAR